MSAALLPLPSDQAVSAVEAAVGPPPDDAKYAAQPVDASSCLTSVVVLDRLERGFPYVFAGGSWIVGPDGKVFALSSNPAIHDDQLVILLLDEVYRNRLASYVETKTFMRRVQRLTQEREELVRAVVEEARAGGLRPPRPRVLP